MTAPRVNHKALPGKETQLVVVDDRLVRIDLGAEMSDLEERRAIRDAEVEFGIRRPRRRLLAPLPLSMTDAAKRHGAAGTAIVAVLIVGAAAMLTLTPEDDRPEERRRPAVSAPPPRTPQRSGAPAPSKSRRAEPRPRVEPVEQSGREPHARRSVSPTPRRHTARPTPTPSRSARPSRPSRPDQSRPEPDQPRLPAPIPMPEVQDPTSPPEGCLIALEVGDIARARLCRT